jgi:acyl-CoA thioesterase I
MIDSSVLLPDPEAPTIAADWRAASWKWMSSRIVSVPVESRTCLVMCSTAMMGSDMDEDCLQLKSTRRVVLGHCSLLVLASGASALVGAAAQAATTRRQMLILVVGDSLSAEYGLKRGSGWVALLEQKLASSGVRARVVNASISGDTTSGGRSRLPALLKLHQPTHVVLELGGNDALRGLPLAMSRDNLAAMVRAARTAGAAVVVVGMQVPPNYGRQYGDDFAALFGLVAKAEGAALVPFLLRGVADAPKPEALFQADRIHPTAAAHPLMLGNVWPVLRPLLK